MTDKEKLMKIKSFADKMYDAAFNLTTDASLLRKAMDDYHQFIINEYHKEEPVSEDLKKVSDKYSESIESNYLNDMFDRGDIMGAFEAGAKWQEDKDKQTLNEEGVVVLPEEEFERMKRSLIELAEKEQQMIKDATGVTVHIDAVGYPYIPQMELYDYDKDVPLAKEGDKYKVILIKEE